MRISGPIAVVAICCSVACGGDGIGDSECELDGSVSGEIAWSNSSSPACVIPFSGSAGILMIFIPLDDELAAFQVDVADITEGETGTFPAIVEIRAEDDRVWETSDCTVEFDSHEFESEDDFSRAYVATGTGECSSNALAVGGGAQGELTIAPFAFHFPPHW
jgi:hypothetical protein